LKRKNILFIARWYPDRYDSMLGLFVRKHAVAVQAFHDVSAVYVAADASMPSGKREIHTNTFLGVTEVRIYFGKSRFAPINAWRYLNAYLEGIKHCNPPDLVHVHVLTRSALPAFWLKITRGIPYVITEHWSRYLPANVSKGAFSGFLRRLITRIVVRHAGSVTTVTQNLADAMQGLGLKNTYHITPNVVDVAQFYPQTDLRTGDFKTLVHVSCFDEPAKNIKGIINATVALAAIRQDFNLMVVGDGKDFESVRTHAEATGLLGSRIQFTGLLEGDELTRVMRQADALVMFSNYENLPCTIIESMASGVPVVSTDVGGIREHLKAEFGILLPAGDVDSLKQKLTEVLDGTVTFDREAMREYALNHFSNESLGKQFHQIYLESGLTAN
jgi:glycosyltransferase involved in cell wall biosynthesis